MKARFSTILTIGFLFSRLGASISALHRKFPNKKKIILKESLWNQGKLDAVQAWMHAHKQNITTVVVCLKQLKAKNTLVLLVIGTYFKPCSYNKFSEDIFVPPAMLCICKQSSFLIEHFTVTCSSQSNTNSCILS